MLKQLDDYWEENKNSIASKSSICMSILGGVGSVLVGLQLYVPASIVLGVVNVGIFFSGISIESMKNDNEKRKEDIISLNKEKQEILRRYTSFEIIPTGAEETPTASVTDTSKSAEPINFELVHYNNRLSQSNSNIFPPK